MPNPDYMLYRVEWTAGKALSEAAGRVIMDLLGENVIGEWSCPSIVEADGVPAVRLWAELFPRRPFVERVGESRRLSFKDWEGGHFAAHITMPVPTVLGWDKAEADAIVKHAKLDLAYMIARLLAEGEAERARPSQD